VSTLKSLLIIVVVGYAVLLAAMFLLQRSMMYFPDTTRRAPTSVGLLRATEVELTTSDGERLTAWHAPPAEGQPVVMYFQGNGGGLDLRAGRFGKLLATGAGLLALNYRGYGGSTGKPTEHGLLRDAAAAYAFAARKHDPGHIVVWGESLGTGVAVALAAEQPVARVVLESPYTSTADIAAAIYPFIPVRWLMHDQFRSDQRIGRVNVPVLVVHGARDITIPLRFAERLFHMISAPKRMVVLPQAGHNDHDAHGAFDIVSPFVLGDLSGISKQP
jgi:fermentation-respiration switch protein FrsA (DUF1100 family)